MKAYLDNGATTRVDDEVLKDMLPYFSKNYGNASSLHTEGQIAKKAMEKARKIIAEKINANPQEIFFTSGGTESNNFAIKGVAFMNKSKGKHIITTKVEHDCVLNACKWLQRNGYDISYIGVDSEGLINLNELEKEIRDNTILVSIIHGNNEIGTIQNLEKIGEICNNKGVYFHTDACQSFTKVPIDVKKQKIDLITINSHKIHGPKGVGALYVKNGTKIDALHHGGGHEKNKRSGTENISGIVGFGKAVEIANKKNFEKMEKLRDYLIEKILEIPETRLNGPKKNRLCNNTHFSFSHIEGESIVLMLDAKGISASTGSACSNNQLKGSHVVEAIGIDPKISHGSLRLTISKYTTKKEIDYTITEIKKIVKRLRAMSPLGGEKNVHK